MHCKSLWIKASAKCINVNVNVNLADLLCLVPQVQWRRQWWFSPANQWSAEFTRHVLVTVRLDWNLGRGGTKKRTRYQVLYPVEKPPKVCRTEPCRTMQWKSAIKQPSEVINISSTTSQRECVVIWQVIFGLSFELFLKTMLLYYSWTYKWAQNLFCCILLCANYGLLVQ